MDDLEFVLFGTFFVVLIQSLIEASLTTIVDDHILTESILSGYNDLDSHDVQLAMVTAALYDYRLNCGLLCFEDDLRFWVKPRSTI
jgi:hypothetical protein